MTSLFLLSHQDDEIGVFSEINRLIHNGHNIWVVFLTTGIIDGGCSIQRNKESLSNLSKLGVSLSQIIFLGCEQKIMDKKLVNNLELAYTSLQKLFNQIGIIHRVYTLAWEGGHPDHDATYLLACAIAAKFNLLASSFQFSLYNSYQLSFMRRVKMFNPILKDGGFVEYRQFSITNGYRFLMLSLRYSSQKTTLLWMLPLLVHHFIFKRKYSLQLISLESCLKRPYEAKLRYEYNDFYSYDCFVNIANGFIIKYIKGYVNVK